MKYYLTLVLCCLGLSTSFSAQNPPPLPLLYIAQPFDVLHYDAFMDLTKAPAKLMNGQCTMTVVWTDDPQDKVFYFHLKGLKVDSVFTNSIKTTVEPGSIANTTISYYSVASPANAKKGDTSYIKVCYSGTMTCETGGSSGWCGGVTSQSGTLYTLGVGFVADYISTTQHWLPCYDLPSDKATFHARFKVPKGKVAVSNGLLTTMQSDSSTTTTEWTHNIPCATYLLTFAVDAYFPLEFGSQVLPMTVYSKSGDTAATRKTFSLLPRMVSAFERKFGAYPFEKVGYVNTPTGAMEHQTMISFPTFLSQSRDTVNSTGAHELAHQWFGDEVSPEDFRNAWLTESFATYSESVWAEELNGFAGYIKSQSGKLTEYFSTASSEGVFSLYDFPRKSPSSNYPGTIYSKGAVVLGMLRYELGDSIFYQCLQKYISTYKYSTANTAVFESLVQNVAGRDLSWFFKQWVHGKGWVKLNVDTKQTTGADGKKAVSIHFTQVQPKDYGIYTNVPIEVGIKAKDGTTKYVIFMLRSEDETFLLPSDFPTDYTALTINQGPTVRVLLQMGTVTNVSESTEKEQPELRILPNPAGTSVQIECTSILPGNSTISIIDIAGRLIYQKQVSSAEFSGVMTLSTSLQSGMYWLTIEQYKKQLIAKQFTITR